MVEVTALGKSYGSVRALDDVRFSIAAGEIVGLLGPNGAGKTTVLKILTGYLQPDHGTVRVDGLDVLTETLAVQERIGYLPENAPLYPELTVQSYLRHIAELRRLSPDEGRARIMTALAETGLADQMTRPIGELSKGYRQRVGLAQAILHQPRLLILDEPSVGLDPTQIVQIRRLIRALARHSTVLFSTHILPEVEALCDRAVIIMQGRIRADADLETLAAGTAVLLTLAEDVPDGAQTAARHPGGGVGRAGAGRARHPLPDHGRDAGGRARPQRVRRGGRLALAGERAAPGAAHAGDGVRCARRRRGRGGGRVSEDEPHSNE